MASTYSPNLALELIGTGDQAGTWGSTTNTNLGTLIEQAVSGYVTQAVATGTDTTITIPNGSTGVARNMYIELTGTGGASTNLIVPANKKLYFIYNNTTGAVTVKVSGQTGVSVPAAAKVILVSNGTDIVDAVTYLGTAITSANIATLTGTTLGYGSASITTASGVTLTYGSASITTLTGTTFGTTGTTQVRGASGSIAQFTATSATVTTLTGTSSTITTIASTSATITGLSSTSANITTLTGTTVSYGSASITTVTGATIGTTASATIRGVSGSIGQFTATSATITTLNSSNAGFGSASISVASIPQFTATSMTVTTLTSTSATITGLSSTSSNITTLTGTTVSYGSASITTVTGATIGTTASATIRGVSGSIGQFTATSMSVTTLTGTSATITTIASTSATITGLSTSSAVITKFTAGSSSVSNLFASGTISDSAGNIRAIPSAGTAKTAAYTLTVADVGEFVELGTGGSIDVPNGIFTAGDAVTIFNNTTGSRPISLTITTAYIAGKDGDTATVSLATRGLATVLFINNSICVVSGNVS